MKYNVPVKKAQCIRVNSLSDFHIINTHMQ